MLQAPSRNSEKLMDVRKMAESSTGIGTPKGKDGFKHCQFCAKPICKNCSIKLYKMPRSDEVGQICPTCEAKMLLKFQFDVARSHLK